MGKAERPWAEAAEEEPVARFLRAAAAQQAAYRTRMRGRTETLEINAAERFVRRWLDRHAAPGGADREALVAALEAAAPDPGASGFALVAAACLLVTSGRFAAGRRYAEDAYARDQHETFAQRLILAADERAPSLRLDVDAWLEDRFCAAPFTEAEAIGDRHLYPCCAAWIPAPFGNLGTTPPEAVWTGARAREVRRSILDGDFGYCSRLSCPHIAKRALPRRDAVSDPALRAVIDSGGRQVPAAPRRVLLSHDISCNLSCPSCRTRKILADRQEEAALDRFYEERLRPLVDGAQRVKITGSGDPFGSRHFRKILKRTAGAAGPQLQLQTNGVLFDARAWSELELEGRVASVWVSVDAARPETYAELRRDGDFDRLMDNLAFLGRLRAEGRIGTLRLDFVVQRDNFREMEAFVALARRIGADGVHFLRLRNWRTFTQQGFLDRDVSNPSHPAHPALLDILARPVFGGPDVDLGNLAPLRAEAAPVRPGVGEGRAEGRALPKLVVFGLPRSGSNRLFEIMRGHEELFVLAEVFNPAGAFGFGVRRSQLLDHFGAADGTVYRGQRDSRLIRRLAQDPSAGLDEIARAAHRLGRCGVAIKVFHGHVMSVQALAALIGRDDVHCAFVTRALLPSYVSLVKARRIGAWSRRDTTADKPTLSLVRFLAHCRRAVAWHRTVARLISEAGKTAPVWRYEDWATASPTAQERAVSAALKDVWPALAAPETLPRTLSPQDREPDPFARFADGAAFRAALAERGALDYAWTDALTAARIAPLRTARPPGRFATGHTVSQSKN
ncbi:hypothetical protein DXV76_05775 [Rhodobacteraceae bacterium CCMM004]|nr:hypothetical protein DXV76_05775 [Rhodobacteraceae bacterium CCMM004]